MIRRPYALLLLASLALAACTTDADRTEASAAPARPPDPVVVGPPSPRPDVPPGGQGIVDANASDELVARPPMPSPTPVTLRREDPDVERAVRLATLLARDVGRRPAGSRGDVVARATIASWLTQAGWDVEEQVVPLPQGGETANLVATWDGRGLDGPHLVVGAHHDTVADSPGANDNASGIGALVALAEELADEAADLPVPLVLVAFGAEEYQPVSPRVHHLGSTVYAEARGGDVVGMVSIDMVANGDETCICWLATGPRTMASRLAALAGPTGYRVRSAGDISDHGPFARRGIPAAFLWTGMDAAWHSPMDTPANVDGADLGRSLRLAVRLVRSLAAEDLEGLRPDGALTP